MSGPKLVRGRFLAEPELRVPGLCRTGEKQSQCIMHRLQGFVRYLKDLIAGPYAGPTRFHMVPLWDPACVWEILLYLFTRQPTFWTPPYPFSSSLS